MKEKENISHFVILGSWNKYILTQDWVKNYLLPNEESIQIQIPVNMDASLKFVTKDLTVSIVKDRFELSVINKSEPIIRKATAIVREIVRLLPHTPVFSFGVNSTFYCSTTEASGKIDFKDSDIELLAVKGMPLQMQSTLRCVKVSDNCFLNLTLQRDENTQEVTLDFNFNYNIKSMIEVSSILGDDDDILLHKRKDMISILKDVYNFTEYGWDITDIYIGQVSRHDWRHEQIDRALKHDPALLYPVFNKYNNEFLKLAMEQTAVKVGKNGFEKDKSPEATEDSPDNPDEYKTHITDAWDTLFVGANFFMPELAYAESGIIFLH